LKNVTTGSGDDIKIEQDFASSRASWLGIGRFRMHPEGAGSKRPSEAVRRWESNVQGTVIIRGDVVRGGECGDGTVFQIKAEDKLLQEYLLRPKEEQSYTVQVAISIGTHIEFIVAPNRTDFCDGIWMKATIQLV
jgi:hypothetical protein